ncbi:MAG TPA: oligosaccharide flippase family protein [Pirellulales bacterium]|nr:oligosaccharide flippase family protein [Pirellulales bacterium]
MSNVPTAEEKPTAPARTVSSARNTVNIFTMRVVTLPLTVVTSILVARILGPQERGIYGFMVLIGAFALPILMLGSGASATYFISSKRYRAADIFLTCFMIGILQGTLGAILLGALWLLGLLGATANATGPSLFIPVLIALPLQGAVNMGTRVALGDSWYALNNRVMLSTALLTGGMLLTLVVFLRLGVQGAVVGIVVNNLILTSGILIASIRHYRPKFALNLQYVRESWRYGLKAWLADLAGTTNLRLDQWILGMANAPQALGIYAPAVVISELLWMIPDSLGFVLFNKIAAAKDPEEQADLVERLNRIIFWTMTLASVSMAVAGPWVITLLYGQQYAASALPLALLMIGTVTFTTQKVLTKYFAGTGAPHHSGTTVAMGALTGLVLYLPMIKFFGAPGAAIAHSACYTMTAVTAVYIYRRLIAPRRPHLYLLKIGDLSWLEGQVRLIRGRQPAEA